VGTLIERIVGVLKPVPRAFFELFFQAQVTGKRRWIAWIWLLGVFALGLYWYWIFFDHGANNVLFHDWANVTAPRYQFLKSAVQELQFPLHISDPGAFHGYTYRYLSVPDTLISPQLIMLGWLAITRFNLFNICILYTLGFLGLLVLKNKFHISLIPFTALALLFNFNGNILAHLSVGHENWGGYFLFSWFAWLVFRLLEGDRSWKWTFGMSSLMFIIWLQGAFHQYIWLLMMLALIAIFVPRTFWFVVRAGVLILVLSAFRLLPAILSYGNYVGGFDNGFITPGVLLNYLVFMANPDELKYFMMGTGPVIGSWELTTFIGLVGTIFVIYFGLYRGLLTNKAPFRSLMLPLGIMLILTGGLFYVVDQLHIPLLSGERISSRMISVVLAFGLIMAAERFQRWLDNSDRKPFLAAASLMAFSTTGLDLWLNLNVWRVSHSSKQFDWVYFDPKKWFVKNDYSDTLYLGLVFGGLAISLVTFIVLAVLSWREMRHERLTPRPASTPDPSAP
jgi:hypothetical protein